MRVIPLLFLSTILLLSCTPQLQACCSLFEASFRNTRGLAAEMMRDGKLIHVLGYENAVTDLSDKPSGGNAMFLPIPAKPRTMTDKNIVSTEDCPAMFDAMSIAVWPPAPVRSRGSPLLQAVTDGTVQVFEHDIYTIVLAEDAADIPKALLQVPESKRPSLNPKIFDAYSKWYKGWTFALCCFNTKQEVNAKPMLWWYEPLDQDTLFFPALDAHDGSPPNLGAQVSVDHSIFVSSYIIDNSRAHKVSYQDLTSLIFPKNISEPRSLLPDYVLGEKYQGMMRNGDFVFKTADVRKGILKASRELPPFAPQQIKGLLKATTGKQ